MNRRYLIAAALIALVAAGTLALAAVGSAGGDDGHDGNGRKGTEDRTVQVAAAQLGGTRFLDVSGATNAGYAELRDAAGIACIEHPHHGGMGVHYVNGDLVRDAFLYPARPEALVYEPTANGKLELVAHEYIVFQKAWDERHDEPPQLFGHKFSLITKPNRYGLDPFYELHAWLWKPNTAGLFADYNPSVDCP